MAVTYHRGIRYSDTDAQEIVFNANYFVYLDDTLTEYLGALPGIEPAMAAAGLDLALAHMNISFRSPARLGETVVTGLRAVRAGNASLAFEFRVWEMEWGRIIAEGSAIHVSVDAQTLDKRPLPECW